MKQNVFLTCSWRFSRSNTLEQLESRLEFTIWNYPSLFIDFPAHEFLSLFIFSFCSERSIQIIFIYYHKEFSVSILFLFFSLGSGERERDDLRDERHRDRARQRNIDRAAPERRSKLERGRERDVSEQIALGIPAKTAGASGEGLFDSRLFNQSRGLSSGNIFF